MLPRIISDPFSFNCKKLTDKKKENCSFVYSTFTSFPLGLVSIFLLNVTSSIPLL